MPDREAIDPDPHWYKDAVVYQLHVKAFQDSDADGVGDFKGLISRLDYLQDLGVTAIWLLPFYPSPLRDDGYDIADYRGVNPDYGTLRDAKRFVAKAHERGMRVITELVLNHTSDQHAWFRRAQRAPAGSPQRDFYVWSDDDQKYQGVRIIFKDFERSNWTWDDRAQAYYWHRFYHHQPDLNFDNPEVHRALLEMVDFWFEAGVDGLRLDAVPYLYEREGTTCENLEETHAFLKDLRAHVDRRFPDKMLLAEANQWPEDAAAYFGEGDECHMAFHFPLMPRLYMAVQMEDRFPILDILEQTPPIPAPCQWAIFLRNHDELTLEMVTDEERDYMYRMYAHDSRARINLGIRRRLAPLLGGSRRKIELMNGLLLSMPGTPVVYYGDEIGMGDNIYLGDRDGVRTPMQWSSDRNAGFSRVNPQRLYLPPIIDPEYNYETINVEAQAANPNSLLWWMRRIIALRQRVGIFGRGELRFLHPDNPKVLAYLRTEGERTVLVIANLSRFVQAVEIDLHEYRNATPVELFGHTHFPRIGDLPYFLTLGPHGFYWFELVPERERVEVGEEEPLPVLAVPGSWEDVFRGRRRSSLESLLPAYLTQRRWFGGKARTIQSIELADAPAIPFGELDVCRLARIEIAYTEGENESYFLPLAIARGDRAEEIVKYSRHAAVARVRARGEEALLYDASVEAAFCRELLRVMASRRKIRSEGSQLVGSSRPQVRREVSGGELPDAHLLGAEQSNTSVVFGDRLIMKLYRRAYPGLNPDLEIGRFLTEKAKFPHTPATIGAIEYELPKEEPRTVAMLQEIVRNEGDAWTHALGALDQFFEQVLASDEADRRRVAYELRDSTPMELVGEDLPEAARTHVGAYVVSAELLGRRTAEMHLALASEPEDPAFAPESFNAYYQRSLYQSMRTLATSSLRLLRRRLSSLPEDSTDWGRRLLEQQEALMSALEEIRSGRIDGLRIRVHGDYHLGQVLFTGRDYVIIDFEGEPARPIGERRIKRSPLRDVAGMLRSFDYAVVSSRDRSAQRWGVTEESELAEQLGIHAAYWRQWVCRTYLATYLDTLADSRLLPRERDARDQLLRAYLLEKALYELSYELNNRPAWTRVPLQGILRLLPGPSEES